MNDFIPFTLPESSDEVKALADAVEAHDKEHDIITPLLVPGLSWRMFKRANRTMYRRHKNMWARLVPEHLGEQVVMELNRRFQNRKG